MISKKAEDIIKYDNYIYSTIKCFVKRKTKLQFDMEELSYCNEDFRNLIIGELIKIDMHQEKDIATIRSMVNDGDNINLPKQEVFSVFHNVQELGLKLYGSYLFPISLSSLLCIINSIPSLQLIRIHLLNPNLISSTSW